MNNQIDNANNIENNIAFLGNEYEFINHGYHTGQYNMDFDVQRLEDFRRGKAPAMFRLYGWKPWAVSLGANQKESDIDREACEKRNIEIVRRPTGGRAVLHAEEITYSVVCPIPEGSSPHDLYRDIHIFLLAGLKKLNIPHLDFEKSQPDFNKLYNKEFRSVSCFASSARWEIESQGKKMVGSAQRVFGDTLLQHGSILLNRGYEQLCDISVLKSEDQRNSLREWTLAHSTSASEASGRVITYEEAAEAILGNI